MPLRAEKPACNILLICEFMLKSLSMKTPRILTVSKDEMKVSNILICLVGYLFPFINKTRQFYTYNYIQYFMLTFYDKAELPESYTYFCCLTVLRTP